MKNGTILATALDQLLDTGRVRRYVSCVGCPLIPKGKAGLIREVKSGLPSKKFGAA